MSPLTSQAQYRPSEFARLAGVTVRALHHYDQLGLLKPSSRTAAGYRLYGPPDIARLQQIVTLKFIGFSLREIKRLLAGADLRAALSLQRNTLGQKRRRLDLAIAAIAQAERVLSHRAGPNWEAFAKIIEVIQMQANTDWTKKYYNAAAQKLLAKRQKLWSPKLQAESQTKWAALLKQIEQAARNKVEPASPEAQALAERHEQLIESFTGGHASIRQGLAELWKDRAHWPAAFKRQVFEPFSRRGIRTARRADPAFLTEPGRKFLEAAFRARWTSKYFNHEAREILSDGHGLWSPELQSQWTALRKDIETAAQKGMDPAGPTARALTRRHAKLMESLTGGNASLREGLARVWKDRANWPTEFLSKAGGAFLKAALKAGKPRKDEV